MFRGTAYGGVKHGVDEQVDNSKTNVNNKDANAYVQVAPLDKCVGPTHYQATQSAGFQ